MNMTLGQFLYWLNEGTIEPAFTHKQMKAYWKTYREKSRGN